MILPKAKTKVKMQIIVQCAICADGRYYFGIYCLRFCTCFNSCSSEKT
jgi:hypothetical protein